MALFLGDIAGDSATTAGMLFIAGGIGMVFIGHLIASAIDEPDELTVTVGGPVEAAPRRVLVAEPAAPGRGRRGRRPARAVEAPDPPPHAAPTTTPAVRLRPHLRRPRRPADLCAAREIRTADALRLPSRRTGQPRGGSSQPSLPPPGPAGWVRG